MQRNEHDIFCNEANQLKLARIAIFILIGVVIFILIL